MAGNDNIVAPTGEPDFVQSLQGFASMCESSGRTGGMSPEDCDMVAGKLRDACFLIDTLQKLRDEKMALGWQLLPATALAERDATIERLTKERDEARVALIREVESLCDTSRLNLESMLEQRARATTAERERDEARAEVERKDAALRLIESWEPATQEITVANMMASEARAALTAKGGENAD